MIAGFGAQATKVVESPYCDGEACEKYTRVWFCVVFFCVLEGWVGIKSSGLALVRNPVRYP